MAPGDTATETKNVGGGGGGGGEHAAGGEEDDGEEQGCGADAAGAAGGECFGLRVPGFRV